MAQIKTDFVINGETFTYVDGDGDGKVDGNSYETVYEGSTPVVTEKPIDWVQGTDGKILGTPLEWAQTQNSSKPDFYSNYVLGIRVAKETNRNAVTTYFRDVYSSSTTKDVPADNSVGRFIKFFSDREFKGVNGLNGAYGPYHARTWIKLQIDHEKLSHGSYFSPGQLGACLLDVIDNPEFWANPAGFLDGTHELCRANLTSSADGKDQLYNHVKEILELYLADLSVD